MKPLSSVLTQSTMDSKQWLETSMPPNFSANVTTPSFKETQNPILSRSAVGAPLHLTPSSQMTSEEPPPISNKTTDSATGSASDAQPATARCASVSRSTISSSRPNLSRTRAKNSAPLEAALQA